MPENLAMQIGVLALAVAGLLTALYLLIFKARPWLRRRVGYWHEKEIEAVLEPLLDQVIVAIFNVSEHSADTLGRALEAVDKQYLARESYALILNLLPPCLPVEVFENLVSRERWAGFVSDRYDKLIAWYRLVSDDLISRLRRANNNDLGPITTLPIEVEGDDSMVTPSAEKPGEPPAIDGPGWYQ